MSAPNTESNSSTETLRSRPGIWVAGFVAGGLAVGGAAMLAQEAHEYNPYEKETVYAGTIEADRTAHTFTQADLAFYADLEDEHGQLHSMTIFAARENGARMDLVESVYDARQEAHDVTESKKWSGRISEYGTLGAIALFGGALVISAHNGFFLPELSAWTEKKLRDSRARLYRQRQKSEDLVVVNGLMDDELQHMFTSAIAEYEKNKEPLEDS